MVYFRVFVMCGIFGYTGRTQVLPILLEGLRALEYRGYDSAGIFIPGAGAFKEVGAVHNLINELPDDLTGTSGIGHMRWATHGKPTRKNAHPHRGAHGHVWVVHNGIVENYKALKARLEEEGHTFESETDTEVIAHLIEKEAGDACLTGEALARALSHVRGAYGIAVIDARCPDVLFAARWGSPITVGVGEEGMFVSSDPTALLPHTRSAVYLEDGEYAVLTPREYRIFTFDQQARAPVVSPLDWDPEDLKKEGYETYLLKEIMEGPEVLKNSVRGRLVPEEGRAVLGGIERFADELRALRHLTIVACGTAFYAGLYGKYLIEELTDIHVDVEAASEFRYRRMVHRPHSAVLAITQSGETADTLESVKEAKRKGFLTLGIVNVVGSSITRITDAGIYNHAGPEISVASTKAYLSQLEVLALLALFLARQREMGEAEGEVLAREMLALPEKVAAVLARREEVCALAARWKDARDFLFLARKGNVGVAYEGALKLKEITYVHAEGYAAGELKHGPLAMIDRHFPTIAVVLQDSVYEKNVSTLEEIKAREGPVIAVVTEGDTVVREIADAVVEVPAVSEHLSPMVSVVPLHLFAYYMGRARGLDVDRPRNLAKSVTVE